MTSADPLQTLLVEDNPGDARYIREVLRDASELSERAGERPSVVGDEQASQRGAGLDLHHETRLSAGLDRLANEGTDVVLLDLNLPDSDGLDTLARVREQTEAVPVVVLTGLRDRELGMEALARGADEYLVKDELNPDLLARTVYHAIERKDHERQLERQRERLEAVNQLNRVVQSITDAVIEQSTREEVERTVCSQLAAAQSYEFAWIGEVDASTDSIVVRASAGDEGYLDEVSVSVDPDDPLGQGPAAKAVRTRETHVQTDFQSDPDFEPWHEQAEKFGYRAGAAIPIVHEDTLYGVLCVYASRPNAFGGEERAVISQVGEIVGHVIASIERKQALVSDDVFELDVRIPDVFGDGGATLDDRLDVDRVLPVEDDEYLLYAEVDEDRVQELEAAADGVAPLDAVTVVDRDGEAVTVELHLTDPPVLTRITSHGGYVESAHFEDGSYNLSIQLPHTTQVRDVLESIREVHPQAEIRAKRQVERSERDSSRVRSALETELTERQRTILETAYYRGYFEWPRDSSGEEIADTLGISSATFSQHLRRAELQIVAALFEDDGGE